MKEKSNVITVIYVFLLIVLQLIRVIVVELEKPIFIITNLLFTVFVITKLISIRKEKKLFINPVFLATIKMFLLCYGATIFYVYIEDVPLSTVFRVNYPYKYLNSGMVYASIGFITMWYSYHSNWIANRSERFVNYITKNKKILRKELKPRWGLVFGIFIISILFKLILVSLGQYGVILTILSEDNDNPILNYLTVISTAGSGSLLFLNLYYFKTGKKRVLFIVFFLIDLFFSILTGFKGAIIMCFIVVLISYYIVNNKIKYSYIIVTVLSVSFAYSVIVPYRDFIQTNSDFKKTSLNSIIQAFLISYDNESTRVKTNSFDDQDYTVIKRLNFTPEFTKFQQYKTEKGFSADDPDFVYMTLTTPFQIFIPRYFWKDKPKSDLGTIWITQKLFDLDYNSSSAFGPLGFLYLTGGAFAIFIGFFIIGFILRVINVFLVSDYWGGIIIVLALLPNAISLEAQYNFYIITFVQTLLFAMVFQLIILKR